MGEFGKVIVMFGKILETRFVDEDTYKLIQKLLLEWQANSEAAEQIKAVVGNPHFNQKWQKRLANCVEGGQYKESLAGIDGEIVDSDEED